ncbi:TPA_asm: type II/IV secretion system protein [Listeria monocytogenes]|nr:type II/IV secretion system protein [Listeria monocytogenes]EAE8920294.1 type II/IV secretion system protein [Listeria monocytogenes]EAF7362120.1 type II/IV secretion system protein [Listeria monocytogenes]EBD1398859.1 type II/IV secretion system protein [Listeria monocytogenes]EEO2782722.1 type II/IV secretion system ATPase subunit [Listeria monocytogenes]
MLSTTSKLDQKVLQEVRTLLRSNYSEVYNEAFSDEAARIALAELIQAEFTMLDSDQIDYAVQEIVGLGFIEGIMQDPDVTDIAFNGQDIIVERNNAPKERFLIPMENDSAEDDIIKKITKFANTVGKDFTNRSPILNSSLRKLRINAVHRANSPYGATMALRSAKPILALHESNFDAFAPTEILPLLKALVAIRSNIVIAGETGTGKTELQKLLISFIPFEERIILIESVLENFAKELFPDKDIFSWLTDEATSTETLIKAALRSHPIWIIIAETLGQEAYEMMQAVLSGHHIITTLHAVNTAAIPERLLNMSKMGYKVDEKSYLDNVYKYFQIGAHIKKRRINGKMVRYLSELVEYQENHTVKVLFRAKETVDGFVYTYGEISEDLQQKLIEFGVNYEGKFLPKKGEVLIGQKEKTNL